MDFILIIWFLAVIFLFIVEYNPRVRNYINDIVIKDLILEFFINQVR